MGLLDEFVAWYGNLQAAVTDALAGPLTDGLKQEIRRQAKARVYAYAGGGCRRGLIGDPVNLEAESDQTELRIRNVTVQQGSAGRLSETNFVESGDPAYHQPGPRPFMDEALQEYAYGKAQDDLAAALRARGFRVE